MHAYRIFIVMAFVGTGVIPLSAASNVLSMRVRCSEQLVAPSVSTGKASDTNRYLYTFLITLKNESSDEVVVPKGGWEPLEHFLPDSGGAVGLSYYCVWDIQYSAENEPNVKSDSELLLARLRPGEATTFKVQVETSAKFSPNKISIHYRLEERFARRYGTWHGNIEATLISFKSISEPHEPTKAR